MSNDRQPGIWIDRSTGFYWLKKPGGRWLLVVPQDVGLKPSNDVIRLVEAPKVAKPDTRVHTTVSENT